jgi:hypothetical protein
VTAVRYPYVISLVVVTLRYESRVHHPTSADGRYLRAVPYIVASLLLGWWGFPWGPWLTLQAVWDCLCGGIDEPGASSTRSLSVTVPVGELEPRPTGSG